MISQRKSYTQRIPSEKIVAKDKPIYHPYQKSYSTTNLSNLKKNLGFSQTGDFFFFFLIDRFISSEIRERSLYCKKRSA